MPKQMVPKPMFKRLTVPENIAAASGENATGHYDLAGLAVAAVTWLL